MPNVFYIVLAVVILLIALAGIIALLIRSLKRSEDPARLLVKWIITALMAGFLIFVLGGWGPNFGSAFVVPFLCVAVGVIMSIVWAPSIGELLVRPITSLLDGGMEELDPQPLYSVAMSRRKQARYQEALWEIQQQLQKFPHDFNGQMMMASIQAEDLKDVQAASLTIQRLCHQKGQSAGNIAGALAQLADWHLKISQDTETARQTLEEIIQRLPGTTWAHTAQQRLAHLADSSHLLGTHDRSTLVLTKGPEDRGLMQGPPSATPETTPAEEAHKLVDHLQEFPEDDEAREKLAVVYAREYQRLDLATLELEQLIAQPSAPAKQIAHWLNLLADLQLELARDEEAARQSLQRIIDLLPKHSSADLARQRQGRLKLEMRKTEVARVVPMGTYEQDLGLKSKLTFGARLPAPVSKKPRAKGEVSGSETA